MNIVQDLKFAARSLRKNPGFMLISMLTLGLGIGANSAMFTIIDRVLLSPLPFPNSESLVNVWETNPRRNIPKFSVSPANYYDWRAQNQVFSAMGAYQQSTFNLSFSEAEPERYTATLCDLGFFTTLQVSPMLGRLFSEEEEMAGRDGVVVLGHGTWLQRFGGDPGIVGRGIEIDGRPRVVIGVMPEGFEFPSGSTMWAPFGFDDRARARRDFHRLRVIARLGNGVELDQARNEFTAIGSRLAQEYPTFNRDAGVAVIPTLEDMVGDLRPMLLILMGAVAFVLMIACANMANLLVVRAASRQREIAVRSALGAGRARIIRQMLTESLLLSFFGGLVGLLIAYSVFRILLSLAPPDISRLNEVSMDWGAVGITAVVTVLTGIIFGLMPAWYASKADLGFLLRQGGRMTTARHRLQSGLVVIQVAAALILLAGAGLLIRSFYNIQRVDAGFDPDNVITMRLAPAPFKFRGQDDQLRQLGRGILRDVSALPGVESASIATDIPLQGNPFVVTQIEGRPPVQPSQLPTASYFAVTPKYIETMRMKLVKGRFFTDQDDAGTSLVAVVNQAFVDKQFPGEDPIGKRITIGFSEPPVWREIIGVVGNVRARALDQETPVQVYAAYLQQPSMFGSPSAITVLARTSQDAPGLGNAIKATILNVDRTQPVYAVQPMTDIVAQSIAERRFTLILLACFAAAALLLAASGLYGVMSYIVNLRTGEIGIRMALGARQGQVLGLIQRYGTTLVLIGMALGMAGALLLTRLMSTLLFQIAPLDPLTFACVAIVLFAVSQLACYLPARRAASVDPMVALRSE